MEATTLPLLVVVLLFVAGLPLVIIKKRRYSPLRLPPGPWQLPLIGSLHHLLLSRHGELSHRTLRDLSARHGPLMLLRLGAVPTLVVSSAEAAREVTRTHDLAFASRHRTPTLDVVTRGGGGILFARYGDAWLQLRRICVLELFSARRVRSFRRVREEEVAALVRSVAAAAADAGAVVDVGDRVSRAVTDSVVRSVVGDRCARRDEFLRELHRGVQLSGGFNLVDMYPSSRLLRRLSRTMRETERSVQNVRGIMADIIRQYTSRREEEEEEHEHLLAVLLRLQRDAAADDYPGLDTDTITTVIMELLSAGSDASYNPVEWAMSELMRNPRVMRKAQAEVRDVFEGQHRLTEVGIDRLTYLHLVIKETFRLHVPVPFLLPRECRETCRVMGYDVPKGTKVLVNAWAIARDPAYWKDPEAFVPERFEASDVDFGGASFEYIPFGAGRRMCPGMPLGLANIELALASLLYHFDWELPDGNKGQELDMTEVFGIVVKRKAKLLLRATTRIPPCVV